MYLRRIKSTSWLTSLAKNSARWRRARGMSQLDRVYREAAKRGVPIEVMIELTHHCNFRCRHCYIPDFGAPDRLSTARLQALQREASSLGVYQIQLTAIQKQLGQIRLLPLMTAAMDSEMVAVCSIFEKSSPDEIAKIFTLGKPAPSLLDRLRDPYYMFYKLAPRGWIQQNMASLALRNQEVMETLDLTNNRVMAASIDAFALREGNRQKRSSPYTWMTAAASSCSPARPTTGFLRQMIGSTPFGRFSGL